MYVCTVYTAIQCGYDNNMDGTNDHKQGVLIQDHDGVFGRFVSTTEHLS